MAPWKQRKPDASQEADVVFVDTERKANGVTYHVHRGPGRAAALSFLRQHTPKEELVYIIVETPEGNIGCDFIYVFEESDGTPIEYVPRPSSVSPQRSTTHCAWCGFAVPPHKLTRDLPRGTGEVQLVWSFDDVAALGKEGQGLVCDECSLLHCIPCTGLNPDGGNSSMPRCRACGGTLGVYHRSELKVELVTGPWMRKS